MQISRPAIELVLAVVEQPGQERLDGGACAVHAVERNIVAELLLAVPGAVPGDEGDVLILPREHRAGVELDAEARRMRPGQRRRQNYARAWIRPLDIGIRNA